MTRLAGGCDKINRSDNEFWTGVCIPQTKTLIEKSKGPTNNQPRILICALCCKIVFWGGGILNFCSEYFRPYHDVQSGYNDVLQLNFPVQRNLNEGLYK